MENNKIGNHVRLWSTNEVDSLDWECDSDLPDTCPSPPPAGVPQQVIIDLTAKRISSLEESRLIHAEIQDGQVVFRALTLMNIAQLVLDDENLYIVRHWEAGDYFVADAAKVVENPEADTSEWVWKSGLFWVLHVNL